MAGTPFSEVFDLFMIMLRDWRLEAMYEYDVDNTDDTLDDYLTGFLVLAITDFNNCTQALTYTNTDFDLVLTDENKTILAMFMVKHWLTQDVHDITQMRLSLQDMDFKHFAESQNLREKDARLQKLREELSQKLVDYGMAHNDWSSWIAGTFYSG